MENQETPMTNENDGNEDSFFFEESFNVTNISSNSFEEKDNINLERTTLYTYLFNYLRNSLDKNFDNKINSNAIRVELPLSQFEKNKNQNHNNYNKSQISQTLLEKNGMDSMNNETAKRKPKDYKAIHSKELMNKWKLKNTENDLKKKTGGNIINKYSI